MVPRISLVLKLQTELLLVHIIEYFKHKMLDILPVHTKKGINYKYVDTGKSMYLR